MKGIPLLVSLFNSESEEVQRYATGAARNLIYENMPNKVALIEAGGIPQLSEALKHPDDELRKNITGENLQGPASEQPPITLVPIRADLDTFQRHSGKQQSSTTLRVQPQPNTSSLKKK